MEQLVSRRRSSSVAAQVMPSLFVSAAIVSTPAGGYLFCALRLGQLALLAKRAAAAAARGRRAPPDVLHAGLRSCRPLIISADSRLALTFPRRSAVRSVVRKMRAFARQSCTNDQSRRMMSAWAGSWARAG